jgi:hypothetical protein
MKETLIRVAKRGLRGFVTGAVASMVVVMGTIANEKGVSTLADLQLIGSALFVSAIIGGCNGFLLATDKFLRSE